MDQLNPGARDARLAAMLDATCRMGSLMLASGTGSFRVKAAMGRVAEAMGVEELRAQVTLNEIVATARIGSAFRTQVVEVPVPHVDAHRLGVLLRTSLRARPGLTPEELHAQLDRAEHRPTLYPLWLQMVGAVAASAAFAFLNNGLWMECLAAGLGAAMGKLVQVLLRRARVSPLADVAIAAAVAGTTYMLVDLAIKALVPGATLHETAFTSALLFLVPGFPLITGALDLARFDFASGLSRIAYVSMVALASAFGGWVVALAFRLTPAELERPGLAVGLLVGLRLIASVVGVVGFALTFNTPWRVALAAGVLGGVANTARLTVIDAGLNPLVATALATFLVGLLAAAGARRMIAPRITLSVPAVLLMVPGSSTYRGLVAMINRDGLGALTHGFQAITVVVALAAGLVAARMLTDPSWVTAQPTWTHMPHTHAQEALQRPLREAEGAHAAAAHDVD